MKPRKLSFLVLMLFSFFLMLFVSVSADTDVGKKEKPYNNQIVKFEQPTQKYVQKTFRS